MRSKFMLFFLILICQLSMAQQVSITPFKLLNNYVFIELQINHSEPLHFMFDTGAGVTVIDTATAERLNLTITGNARIRTSGGTISSNTSGNNQLRIDDFVVDKVDLEIMPLGHLAAYLEHPLDGIIGYDLLRRFGVEINTDQGLFKIFRGDTGKLNLKNGTEVKMHRLPYNLYGIKMLLKPDKKSDPIELLIKIDSGFEDALNLNGQTVTKYELLKDRRVKGAEGMSADPTITQNYTAKLNELSFAGGSWKKVPTVLTVDPINVQSTEKDLSHGIIGQALLLDFNILYDMPNERIVFQKRKRP